MLLCHALMVWWCIGVHDVSNIITVSHWKCEVHNGDNRLFKHLKTNIKWHWNRIPHPEPLGFPNTRKVAGKHAAVVGHMLQTSTSGWAYSSENNELYQVGPWTIFFLIDCIQSVFGEKFACKSLCSVVFAILVDGKHTAIHKQFWLKTNNHQNFVVSVCY